MAQQPDSGEVFLREVDDEYRRDKVAALWSKWGRWLFVGIGVLLVVVAGYLFWRQQQAEAADTRAASFAGALRQLGAGDAAGAAPALTALTAAPEPGYRALAVLSQAAVDARDGREPKALSALDALIADDDVAAPFRDLALIKATQLRFDTLPPAQVTARLRALATPGNPWFASAAELSGLAHLKEGKPALARPLFDAIVKDERAPPSLRGRVQQLLATLPPAPPSGIGAPTPPLAGATQ